METVQRNAEQSLARHKVARAGDLTARSQALQELQDTLEMADAPLRIECFDVSHVQGTNVVASMVVFEDGLPRKSEYRRFIVRGTVDEQGAVRTDDTAAMHEVLTRRFRRYLDDRVDATDIEGVGSGAPGADDRDERDGDDLAQAGDDGEDGAGVRAEPDRPRHRAPAPVRLPAQPRRRRRRPAAGQRRPAPRSPSWASTTSPWSAWPSASRRSGCPGRSSR